MNKPNKMSVTEKICLAVIVVVMVALFAILLWYLMPSKTQDESGQDSSFSSNSTDLEEEEESLTQPEAILPQNLNIGEVPAVTTLTNQAGEKIDLKDRLGTVQVLIFWASYCPYCEEQLEALPELSKIAEQYQAKIVLVDKLDPDKETKEAAVKKAASAASGYELLIDEDLSIYHGWGLQRIPTIVVLNEAGEVGAYDTAVIGAGELQGLLEYATAGADAATRDNLTQKLMNSEGGVYANLASTGDSPTGKDVLSESQGLLMQYAVWKEDQKLFDTAWGFVQKNMLSEDGLCYWYVGEDGKKPQVNATLDDLRICAMLYQADKLWGGYAGFADDLADAIATNCLREEQLVNFFDFESKEQDQSISLPSADLELLSIIGEHDDRFVPVAENMKRMILDGYISDDFPMFYAQYQLDKGTYVENNMNTSEMLYTAWTLAKFDLLPASSVDWIKKQVSAEGLGAQYTVSGEIPAGYDYHSTAVYALAALIGEETGDQELTRMSLQKMERYRIHDASKSGYGGYGENGLASAFDQLMPMLANAGVYAKRK